MVPDVYCTLPCLFPAVRDLKVLEIYITFRQPVTPSLEKGAFFEGEFAAPCSI